jgi:hypothetical protein
VKGRDELPSGYEVLPTFVYTVLESKNAVERADIAEWYVEGLLYI